MKITPFLISAFLVLTTACNDDDNDPVNPIDQLPPATQVGAQTFGCLVDGEILTPNSLGNNNFNAFYQEIDGFYYLGISMSSGSGIDTRALSIQGTKTELIQEKEYLLVSENDGKFNGLLIEGGGNEKLTVRTTDSKPGKLIITNYDPENFILSGTFEFTVLDDAGKEIKITDGRFDVLYTN